MKIEEGMYVRTPLGISKFLGFYDGNLALYEFDKLNEELWSGDIYGVVFECEIKEVVLKASHNIIDLIEVGDYVNGYIVCEIDYAESGKYVMVDDNVKGWQSMYFNNQIKSIVTKEQFEQMSYKVGEANEIK